MPWPLSQDYNEAIQDPAVVFADPELKAGEAVANALGVPMPRSGNFADVYEFNCPAKNAKYAIKCFTRQVPGLQERYSEISNHLAQAKLPFMVDFQYQPQGIRIRGEWYPILKMQWVEGLLLNQFVRDNLDKPNLIDVLSKIWVRMGKRLREAKVAHADLQHGNVILVPGAKANVLSVRLIDYDGMFVPTLADKKSGEVGHPAFQHPERLKTGAYNGTVDRFALLLVATALRALQVSGRTLWEPYDNGDNLLFRQADLAEPANSKLFQELWNTNDAALHDLTGWLYLAASGPLQGAPDLDLLVNEAGQVKPLSAEQEAQVKAALGPGAAVTRKAATAPPSPASAPMPKPAAKETRNDLADLEPAPARPQRAAPAKKLPLGWILGGAGVGVGLLALILVLTLGGGGGPDDKNQAKVDPNKDKKVQKDKKIDLDKKIVNDKKIDDKKDPLVLDPPDKKEIKPVNRDPNPMGAPVPNLVYVKNEEGSNGKTTKHWFRVVNFSDFGQELFVKDPTLGLFGKNPNAPRTIVEIYAADGKLLYQNGSAISPRSLENIWLDVEKGAAPPDAVYVVLNDRKTKEQMKSNLVKVEGGTAPVAGPPPSRPPEVNGLLLNGEIDCGLQAYRHEMSKSFDIAKSWALSFDCWIPDRNGESRLPFIWGDERGGLDPIYIQLKGVQLTAVITDCRTNGGHGLTADLAKFAAPGWINITLTYTQTSKEMALYLDKNLAKKEIANVIPNVDRPMPVWLGGANTNEQRFGGKLKDLWIGNLDSGPAVKEPVAAGRVFEEKGSIEMGDGKMGYAGKFLEVPLQAGRWHIVEATCTGFEGGLVVFQNLTPIRQLTSNETLDPRRGNPVFLAVRPQDTRKHDVLITNRPGTKRPLGQYVFKAWEVQQSESWNVDKTVPARDKFDMLYSFDPNVTYVLHLESKNIGLNLSITDTAGSKTLALASPITTPPNQPRSSALAFRSVSKDDVKIVVSAPGKGGDFKLTVFKDRASSKTDPKAAAELPTPKLMYQGSNAMAKVTHHQFAVTNHADFKGNLRVSIWPDQENKEVETTGRDLKGFAVIVRAGEQTPKAVFVLVKDQQTGKEVKSNLVDLPQPKQVEPKETALGPKLRDHPGIDYWANTWTALVRGHPEIVHLGKHNPKDIFLTPPRSGHSEVHFPLQPLKAKVVRFRGAVTIADNPLPSKTALKFSMQTTDAQAWYSKPIAKNGDVEMFDVPLTNPTHLNLIVECPGDMGNAWALWLAPRVVLEGGQEVFLADVPVQRVQGSSTADKAALEMFQFMPDSPQTFGKKFASECWQIMAPRQGLGRIGIPVPAEARFFHSGYGVPDMAEGKPRDLHFALLQRLDTTRFNNQKYKILWLSPGKHVPGQLDQILAPIPKDMDHVQLAVISRQQDGQSVAFVAPRFLATTDGVPEALVRKSWPAALASRKMSNVVSFDKGGWYKDSGKSLPFFNQLPWCQVESANVLAMPAPSGASFAVGKIYGRFTGFMANAQRGKIDSGELFFRVLGDGKQIWKSPALTQTEPVYFEVPIAGVDNLRLETQVVGMVGNHQPVWVEPSLHVE